MDRRSFAACRLARCGRHAAVDQIAGGASGGVEIGLWEEETRVLFAGDAIYDGPLIDFLHEGDIAAYVVTMRRLRDGPADVVHAGHDPSFGRDRLVELADAYLAAHA